jgi:hypothetical protein
MPKYVLFGFVRVALKINRAMKFLIEAFSFFQSKDISDSQSEIKRTCFNRFKRAAAVLPLGAFFSLPFRLTSFQRQLNLYGFRRLTQGPDGGAYYHEMFLRGKLVDMSSGFTLLESLFSYFCAGRPALCCRMRRQKVKGTGHKQPSDANTEPNLYSFPRVVGTDHEEDNNNEGDDSQSGAENGSETIESAAAIEPPSGTSSQPTAMSPGIASIHGAAHLLRRIASDERGVHFAGLPPSAPVAHSQLSSVSARAAQETLEPPRGAYFLRQSFVSAGDMRHSREGQGDQDLSSPKPRLPGGHNFRTSDSTPSA